MNTTLKHRQVKVIKDRICVGCASTFPKGTDTIYWVGTCEGDFQANWWCLCCNAYLMIGDPNEGITFGQFGGENDYLRFKHNFYEQRRNKESSP